MITIRTFRDYLRDRFLRLLGVLMSLNGLAVLVFGIMPEPLMALCLYSIQVSL